MITKFKFGLLIALFSKKKKAQNDNACLGKAGASKWSKLSIMVLQFVWASVILLIYALIVNKRLTK
jgi:hypothetical protein